MADVPITEVLGPAGGGAPFWGLNDAGQSSATAPKFALDPWDTFWLGTRQLPGECVVNPGSVARIEVNRKKGKGTDGARVTLAGYDPREFTVTCQMITQEHWTEMQDIADVYWRICGKTSNLSQPALSVYHPNLAWLKIYSAVLVGITPLVPGQVEGSMSTTLTFQEAPPITGKKNVTKTAGPPAEDPRKPSSAQLGATAPRPPESKASNLSTKGPR